ncbi:MAG: hypothetical protein WDN69_06545 [Aliidongia sp.]
MTDPVGATIQNAAAMAPRLTVAAIGPEVSVLQPDGSPVYRWRLPLDQMFTVPQLLDPWDVQVSGYDLLPDGSVLALARDERHFPAFHWDDTVMNTALVKLDRDSHLVWSYLGNPHHDVRAAPDGTIYVLVARDGATPPGPHSAMPPSFRDEGVAVLDADGHEQRILWLADALARSPLRQSRGGDGAGLGGLPARSCLLLGPVPRQYDPGDRGSGIGAIAVRCAGRSADQSAGAGCSAGARSQIG